jgi:predicted TIM-barrel fold metal-dependent hydrolase
MIVDSHAHVSRSDWSSPKFLEEVIEPVVRASGTPIPDTVYEGTDIPAMMDAYRAAGVDKVLLYAVAPREPRKFGRNPNTREISGAHVSNEYIADVCRQYPDLTLPVASFNPRYEGATIVDDMERAVEELGARAIKLYPTYNHYRPDDRELCWPIYAKALELNVPVIVHQSWTTLVDAPMKYQHPAQLDDVARDFRELVLICAHFGVPWIEEAMCLVGKHDNVYVDVSYWASMEDPEIILRHLLRCPRYGCTYDRILWGTDFPVTPPGPSLELFRETLPALAARLELDPIPAEGLDLMLGGNAARIYGLA